MVNTAKKWLEEQYENMIKDLSKLIACQSYKQPALEGKPFGQGCHDALMCAKELCEKFGFTFHDVDGYAGYIDYEETGVTPEVGILCHLDVVPADNFRTPPFNLIRRNGKLIARGVIDDKGPAIIMIYALKALKMAGFKPEKNIRLIFGLDEESGWADIDYYKSKEEMPKVGYSPDADYPLINREKGIVTIKLTKPLTSKKVLSIKGGSASNMVPDRCTFVLNETIGMATTIFHRSYILPMFDETEEGLEATFVGQMAHASIPTTGENAIIKGVESVRKLDSAFNELFYLFNDAKGLDLYDKEITLNLGKINYDGKTLEMLVDLRYPHNVPFERVDATLHKVLKNYEIEYVHHMPPHGVDENDELCVKLLNAFEIETGRKGKPLMIGGGTYSRAFEKGVAFGCVFEDEPMMAHKANEYMLEENFKLNCKIQVQGIYQLCK